MIVRSTAQPGYMAPNAEQGAGASRKPAVEESTTETADRVASHQVDD